jgi:hypothetical protein
MDTWYKITAAVWYGILISGVTFSGILKVPWYHYTHGINIYIYIYLYVKCTNALIAHKYSMLKRVKIVV